MLQSLILVMLCAIFIVAVVYMKSRIHSHPRIRFNIVPTNEKFSWRDTEPVKYRPMKPVYAMVMNIGKVEPNDWLQIDKDYLQVVDSHLKTLDAQPDLTCKANPSRATLRATQEVYDLVVDVLLQRYPLYFEYRGDQILNSIRGIYLPRYAARSGLEAEQLLRLLMENTEEDFQILQYDSNSGEYIIRAIGGLTSDGFVWQEKLDKKLTDVHAPVPGYEERLKLSMNRFFKKLQPGSIIQRFTWGIHLGERDMKFNPQKHADANVTLTNDDVDFENGAWLRVERQCPQKLLSTDFIFLTQHTYWYPLKELKDEGIGPLTADSIDSWPAAFADYKGRAPWHEVVCDWLRK